MSRDDLFAPTVEPEISPAAQPESKSIEQAPLAARMRPRSLDEFAGQQHILAPGQLLRRAIESDRIQSLMFYGPPSAVNTSLAQLMALQTTTTSKRLCCVEPTLAAMRRVLLTPSQ